MKEIVKIIDETFKPGEVCTMLKISRHTLSHWVKTGKLHPIIIGDQRRYKISEIKQLIKI